MISVRFAPKERKDAGKVLWKCALERWERCSGKVLWKASGKPGKESEKVVSFFLERCREMCLKRYGLFIIEK